MRSSLVIEPRGHWVNGWFLRLFSRPVAFVDGTAHSARWSRPVRIPVAPGRHRVAVGARYRGTRSALGRKEATIHVAAGQDVFLRARNGFLNHQPFVVTVDRRRSA